MRTNDNVQRLFAYCHDTFTTCSNSPRVVPLTQLFSQRHFPFFFPILLFIILSSILPQRQLYNQVPIFHRNYPFYHNMPPEYILWTSFDSVTTSLGSLLSRWPGDYVRHYILETDLRHHNLSSFLSSSTKTIYTTLSHLLYHLKLLKTINIDLTIASIDTNKKLVQLYQWIYLWLYRWLYLQIYPLLYQWLYPRLN